MPLDTPSCFDALTVLVTLVGDRKTAANEAMREPRPNVICLLAVPDSHGILACYGFPLSGLGFVHTFLQGWWIVNGRYLFLGSFLQEGCHKLFNMRHVQLLVRCKSVLTEQCFMGHDARSRRLWGVTRFLGGFPFSTVSSRTYSSRRLGCGRP